MSNFYDLIVIGGGPGGHLAAERGAYAGEMIRGAAQMLEMQLRVTDARQIIFPHPTVSEIIRKVLWEFKD